MTIRNRMTAVLLAALLLGGSACMAGSDMESEDGEAGITGGGGEEEGEGEGGYGGGEEGEEGEEEGD